MTFWRRDVIVVFLRALCLKNQKNFYYVNISEGKLKNLKNLDKLKNALQIGVCYYCLSDTVEKLFKILW